jgi:drug/metabolite transporter (DMT)-like permease
MTAFAANSLLTRAALGTGAIDAVSFTTVRILAGAAMLAAIVGASRIVRGGVGGDWLSAGTLFVYAIAFSAAYLSLSAGTGALILFGAAQVTMIVAGLRSGERLSASGWLGFAAAVAGVVYLVAPGVTAPPALGAALMAVAGIGWGVYSLLGRRDVDPLTATAGNFVRSAPLVLVLSLVFFIRASGTWKGLALAAVCGAVTSGLGYVVWYTALRGLTSTRAAAVQLSVPALAALGGVLFLSERFTWRLLLSSAAILGGIALVLARRADRASAP